MKKLIIVVCLLSATFFVFASKGPASLPVTYNNIKIMVDGAPIALKCEPFIMKDGSIGGSLTEIAKALGKNVKYDSKNATLYIGKQPSGTWIYLSDLTPLQYDCDFILNPAEAGKPFSIAGKDYIKGIQMASSDRSYIDFNLGGEFVKLSGDVGIDDLDVGFYGYIDVYIYCDDQIRFYKKNLKVGDFPVHFEIDVTNVIKIKLKAVEDIGDEWYHTDWANVVLER